MKNFLSIVFLLFSLPTLADVAGVARVTDGDTIKIEGIKIRLHGIDAPERKQTCEKNGRVWRCGSAATAKLRGMASGREVTCNGNRQDRYGRLIAVCYVNNTDLNAAMVASGLALAYRRYSTDYVSVERSAKRAGRGMWAGEFVAPWDFRRGKRLKKSKTVDQNCCRVCSRGKACGDACINRNWSCSKPAGCACNAS